MATSYDSPVLPTVMAGSFTDLLAQFPRFDGTTDTEDFVRQFATNLLLHAKPSTWAVISLGHFLDGAAKSWWITVAERFTTAVIQPGAVAEDIWQQAVAELLAFFPVSIIRARSKEACRARKYQPGESASDYIAGKLALIHAWKPTMREEKKLKEILRGLPLDIAQALVSQTTTVAAFMKALQTILDLRRSSTTSKPQPQPPPVSTPSYPLPRGPIVCNYCHFPGHFKRSCQKFAADNPMESARLRERRGENPLTPRFLPLPGPRPMLALPAPPPPNVEYRGQPSTNPFSLHQGNFQARGSGTTGQ
ncbi:unnamed protein product [Orchesella dallaii]|uniref:CCHC-type domain-containing protein n=2 Tax=Orchesella dallaii TaxID=48710 RepID=A0ABP1S877_9HEXA